MPPFEGAGESQFRVLIWVPPPQVTLHAAKAVQDPQFPSESGTRFINIWAKRVFLQRVIY